LRRGVDLYQQLAFLHLIAGFDMDLADLPGRLGAHIHIASRLQSAQGGDAVFNVAAGHGNGGQAVAPRRLQLPGGDADNRDQARHNQQGVSGRSRAFHGLVPARKVRTAVAGG